MRHGLACRPARGQALLETLLVAMLAVPMLLGTLFLFELQAAQQATLAAARQALFQHHYARGTISAEEAASDARREHLEPLFASGLGAASGAQVSLSAVVPPPSIQQIEDIASPCSSPPELWEPVLSISREPRPCMRRRGSR